jgi:flagellar hook protein FlgE
MTGGTITKVGTSAVGSPNLVDTSAIFANPGAPSSILRVYMPDHGFNVDDYVAFMGTNVPASLASNSYKVTSKGTFGGTNYFEFDMGTANVAAAATIAASPDLPVGMEIDLFGQFDNNVSLSDSLDGTQMPSVFDPAYGSGKNLVTGVDLDTFNTSINIYDSLGNPFGLNIAFAKTSKSQWTYQLYFARDSVTNNFPVSNVGSDGILQGGTGTITFDGQGAIQSVDNANIDLKWISGSTATSFILNFGKSALDNTAIFTSGGVKQTNGPKKFLQQTRMVMLQANSLVSQWILQQVALLLHMIMEKISLYICCQLFTLRLQITCHL